MIPHAEPQSIVAPNVMGSMEVAWCWKFFAVVFPN